MTATKVQITLPLRTLTNKFKQVTRHDEKAIRPAVSTDGNTHARWRLSFSSQFIFFCSRPISSRTIRYFFVARFMVLAPLLALFYVRSDFQNQNSRARCQPRFTFRDDDGMPHNINSLSLQHLTCHDVSCFFAYF